MGRSTVLMRTTVFLGPICPGDRAGEVPTSTLTGREVLVLNPPARPRRMSSYGPWPQRLPDRMVHEPECAAARPVPVVIGPASDHPIEDQDQHSRRSVCKPMDGLPDLAQESLNALLGWLGEQLVVLPPDRLA